MKIKNARPLALLFAASAIATQLALAAGDDEHAAAEAAIERIEERLTARPDDAMLRYFLAIYQARAGRKQDAMQSLERLLPRRLGFRPPRDVGFDAFWNDADFQALLARFDANEPPVAKATPAFELPDATFIPEGISHDPRTGSFFIGSTAQRRILERRADGKFVEFSKASDALKGVLGLRVDATRRRLYAVSTSNVGRRANEPLENAVFVYDLDRRTLLKRYAIADTQNLNDVAISKDGTVVVSDSMGAGLYRLDAASDRFVPLVPAGELSCNGIDFSTDGHRLFVASTTGVVVVDMASGKFERLPQPDDIAAGAIDGLYFHRGDLIGVQNTISPGRVVRLHLAGDASRIDKLTVLQSYGKLLDEPTTGAIVGNEIFVIANSSVPALGDEGVLRDPATLRRARIVRIPL